MVYSAVTILKMSTSIDEFRQLYPSKETFNLHLLSFSPFVVRQAEILNPLLMTELAQIDAVVDVSCVDKKADGTPEFKGNITEREILYMELQKFVGGYVARRDSKDHWLFDADLSFYLSQLQVYPGNKEQTKSLGRLVICNLYQLIVLNTYITLYCIHMQNL